MAWNTGQYPSQYRHALQTVITRWPSRIRSAGNMRGRLLTGDPTEYRSDCHPDASDIALAENVSCHDLSGREDVHGGLTARHEHASALVHRHSQIGERDAWPQRIPPERRRGERLRPVRLVWRQPLGPAIVQHGM